MSNMGDRRGGRTATWAVATGAFLVTICLFVLAWYVLHRKYERSTAANRDGMNGTSSKVATRASGVKPTSRTSGESVDAGTMDHALDKIVDDYHKELTARPPGFMEEIGIIVADLSRESLAEGLAGLAKAEPYSHHVPYAGGFAIRFPPDRNHGNEDAERVFSNRRFLKVYGELAALPRQEAARVVSEQIQTCLSLIKSDLSDRLEGKGNGRNNPGMMGEGWNDDPNGKPTHQGLRYQLYSLVMLAGNLQLEQCHADVCQVAAEACRQYDFLSHPDGFEISEEALSRMQESQEGLRKMTRPEVKKFIGLGRLLLASIYSPPVLSTGLIGTMGKSISDVELPPGTHWVTKRLTTYDALVTPYESRIAGPADYSKGEIVLRYLSDVGKPEMDQIIRKFTNIPIADPNGNSATANPTGP